MDLTGRIAVVTGVGKRTGLGYELCRQLTAQGCRVYLTARRAEVARELAATLRPEAPAETLPFALDVAKPEEIEALRAAVEIRFGKLDILINNATGISPFGETAAEADLNAARAVFETTLFGTWAVCQSLSPLLRQSDAGRIVTISSGSGSHGDALFGLTTGDKMGASYSVAKAALNALTARLASEEANAGLRVNAVCPGFTATFEGGEAMGARPVAESAKGVLWAVSIPNDGPTGGFFRDGERLPW